MHLIVIYCILGILAFLLLLTLLPFHVYLQYKDELIVKIRYVFVFLTVYPRPDKPTTKKKAAKTKKKGKPKKENLPMIEQMLQEEGIAAVADYLTSSAKLAGSSLKKVLAAITVDSLSLDIRVASEEAASTAVDYGKVCAAVYPAEGLLESLMHVRHRSIQIAPDFLGDKGEIRGDIRLHVIPIQILCIGIQFFIGYIGNAMRKN